MSLNLNIPSSARLPLKITGYVLFALLAFATSFYLSIPYDRVKDRLEAELSRSWDYDVTIGELGPSPLFGVAATDVVLKSRASATSPAPTKKEDKNAGIKLERASISVSPWGFLVGNRKLAFTVHAFGGTISGAYRQVDEDVEFELDVAAIALGRIPGVKETVTVPLTGTLSVDLGIELPKGKLAQSNGELEFTCDGCTMGDGKARLKLPSANPMLKDGVIVDKISFGRFSGHIEIEKGTARLRGVRAKSTDGELILEGELSLSDPLRNSSFRTAYLRFRPTDACKKKTPFSMLDMVAGATAKRTDGFYGWRLMGLLTSPNFTPSKVSPVKTAGGPKPPGRGPGGRRRFGPGKRRPGMSGMAGMAKKHGILGRGRMPGMARPMPRGGGANEPPPTPAMPAGGPPPGQPGPPPRAPEPRPDEPPMTPSMPTAPPPPGQEASAGAPGEGDHGEGPRADGEEGRHEGQGEGRDREPGDEPGDEAPRDEPQPPGQPDNEHDSP